MVFDLRRGTRCTVLSFLVCAPFPAGPAVREQAAREHAEGAAARIGVLFWHESPNDELAWKGVRQAFELASFPVEWDVRRADEDAERARSALRELEDSGVDLVLALGTEATLRAKETVTRVPVVFTAVTHPVESGIVADWGPTGRDLAGNSNWIDPDIVAEVFELAIPGLERLGMLRSVGSGRVSAAELRGMRRHLEEHPGSFQVLEEVVEGPQELPAAVQRLLARDVEAIWIPIDFTVYEHLDLVQSVTGDAGIPLVSSSVKGVLAGAVASVLVDYELLGQRAGEIARRILRGEVEAGSLPIGRLQSYQVVVDLDAARRCGYELPLSLLALADRIHVSEPPDAGR